MAMSEAMAGALIKGAGTALAGGASALAAGNLNRKNRKFQQEEAEKQRAWNETMAEKQNAWNYDMWLKATEYDSPANQMQRLLDAGLNPLYFGLDGNASQAAPEAAQPLGYERASAGVWNNPIQSGLDAAIKVAQVSNIQADTAKKGEETLEVTKRREKIQADIELARQELQNKLAEEGLTKAKKEEIERNLAWLDRINEAAIAMQEAETALKQSQKKRIEELLEGEKLLQIKTAEDFDHKWKKIDAEIAKLAEETGLLKKDIENYALNHASNGFMGSGLSLQNLFRVFTSGNRQPKERDIPDDVQDIINSGQ